MPVRHARVLITGGSSGIGLALSEALLKRQCRVVAVSHQADELAALPPQIAGWQADLADPSQVAALVPRFEAEVGPLDILVNNAGLGYHQTLLESDLERVRHLFEVNFFAVVALSQAALRAMASRRTGHILNVSSASARRTLARMTAYGSSKAAVHGFTQSLRLEAAPHGVKVSELLPISVRTPFFAQAGYQPKGRVQTPERVARAALRCLDEGLAELCTDASTGWGLGLDALFPNAVARLLQWLEQRAQARASRRGS